MKNVIAERRKNERDERMKRIIAAAKKVFLERGYFGTGVRGIAYEARLSPGAIY
jgi:AcrR family transcriptional regulator